jgi:hypothetical protein
VFVDVFGSGAINWLDGVEISGDNGQVDFTSPEFALEISLRRYRLWCSDLQ